MKAGRSHPQGNAPAPAAAGGAAPWRPRTALPLWVHHSGAPWLMLWALCASLAGLAMLLALPAAASGQPLGSGWHLGFTTLACLLLLSLPFFTFEPLRAQRRVWLGRVAPQAAWQAALASHQRQLLLSWALLALPLLLLRLLAPPGAEPWAATLLAALWPAALLAALMGLALLAAAACAGQLAWPWGLGAVLALLALVMPGPSGVPAAALPAFGQAPGWGLAAALCALLAATGLLCSRLVHQRLAQDAATVGLGPGPLPRLLQGWQRAWAHWRPLDGGGLQASMLVVVLFQLHFNLSSASADARVLQPMGSGVTPQHGLTLVFFTMVALALLRGGPLHWRVLLAPGAAWARSRSGIGLHIVGSTLVSMAALMALLLGLVVLLSTLLPFLPPVPWQRLPGLALSHGPPLGADLLLAVTLAAWLRGALGAPQPVMAVLVGAVLLWALGIFIAAPLLGLHDAAGIVLWHRGPAHLAGQLAGAGLCLLLAQRVWARADLGALARRPARNGLEGGPGG